MVPQHHVPESKREGNCDSSECYVERSSTYAEKVFRLSFQTYGEKQEDGPYFSHSVNCVSGNNQSCTIGSHKHTRKYFSQNGGELESFKDLSKQLGPYKDEEELEEKWVCAVHSVETGLLVGGLTRKDQDLNNLIWMLRHAYRGKRN